MIIRGYREEDIPAMTAIWNEVVEEGVAFPQEDFLEGLFKGRIFRSKDPMFIGHESKNDRNDIS